MQMVEGTTIELINQTGQARRLFSVTYDAGQISPKEIHYSHYHPTSKNKIRMEPSTADCVYYYTIQGFRGLTALMRWLRTMINLSS